MGCDDWCFILDDTRGIWDEADDWSLWVTKLMESIEGFEDILTKMGESSNWLISDGIGELGTR